MWGKLHKKLNQEKLVWIDTGFSKWDLKTLELIFYQVLGHKKRANPTQKTESLFEKNAAAVDKSHGIAVLVEWIQYDTFCNGRVYYLESRIAVPEYQPNASLESMAINRCTLVSSMLSKKVDEVRGCWNPTVIRSSLCVKNMNCRLKTRVSKIKKRC